jgi:hypothetical protein
MHSPHGTSSFRILETIEAYTTRRRWTFYVLLIWTGGMLASIIFFVPETYHPVYVFPNPGITATLRMFQTLEAQGAEAAPGDRRRSMESSNRKAAALCGPHGHEFHVPAHLALDIGTHVSMPLHFLGHPIGYSVPLLRCFPASFLRGVWARNMATWTVFPWSLCRNGYSHFVGSNLAPQLCSLGA